MLKLLLLIFATLASSSSFTLPPRSPLRLGISRTQASPLTSSSLSLIPPSTVLAFDPESVRQCVPLAVCSLVILDIVLGSPFLKSVTSKINPANTPPPPPSKTTKDPSRPALVDVDALVAAARFQADAIAARNTYLAERRGPKEDIIDLQKRIQQEQDKLTTRSHPRSHL